MKKVLTKIATISIVLMLLMACDHVYMLRDPFKVSFDAGLGTGTRAAELVREDGTFTVPDSSQLTAPANAPHFLGWEYDGVLYKTGDIITVSGPVTIKAIWEENRTVSFEAGEGSGGAIPSEKVMKGSLYVLPANEGRFLPPLKPVKDRAFVGWNVRIGNGRSQFLHAGETIRVTDDTLAVAVWDVIYKVIYAPGIGGSGKMDPPADNVMKGDDYTIRSSTFVPDFEKQFDKWEVKVGPLHAYTRNPGEQITVNGVTTITALWKPAWSIQYEPGEGTAPKGVPTPKSVDDGFEYTLPNNTAFVAPLPTGRKFRAWKVYKCVNNKKDKVLFTSRNVGQPIILKSSVILEALWTDSIEVVFDKGGDGASGSMKTNEIATGDYIVEAPAFKIDPPNVPECFVAPTGKMFRYWELSDLASGDLIKKGITPGKKLPDLEKSIKLTAIWQGKWDVTFDPNTGSGTMENGKVKFEGERAKVFDREGTISDINVVSIPKGKEMMFPANTFVAPSVPAGREFIGWRVGSTMYAPGDSIPIKANTTVFAEWTPVITIKFAPNGGYVGDLVLERDPKTGKATKSINYPAVEDVIMLIGKNGYAKRDLVLPPSTYGQPSESTRFKGWMVDGVLKQPGDVIPMTELKADRVIEADWLNLYKISFNINDKAHDLIAYADQDIATTPKSVFVEKDAQVFDPVYYDYTKLDAKGLPTKRPAGEEKYPRLWRYQFLGWQEEGKTGFYDFANSKIVQGVVLHAVWDRVHVADRSDLIIEIYNNPADGAVELKDYMGTGKFAEAYKGDPKTPRAAASVSEWSRNSTNNSKRKITGYDAHVAKRANNAKRYQVGALLDPRWSAYNELNYIDTSKVTNMDTIFQGSNNNYVEGGYNISNLSSNRLKYAAIFNGEINKWNTSKVTSMNGMFKRAFAFNQDINSSNTPDPASGVITPNITPPEPGAADYVGWDVSAVKEMRFMFHDTQVFDRPLDNWTTKSLTDLQHAFLDETNFNQSLANWDVDQVKNFKGMFAGARRMEGDLSGWNIVSATEMQNMYGWCVGNINVESKDISDWRGTYKSWDFNSTESKAHYVNLSGMFRANPTVTVDGTKINSWKLNRGNINISSMFRGSGSFDKTQLTDWVTPKP